MGFDTKNPDWSFLSRKSVPIRQSVSAVGSLPWMHFLGCVEWDTALRVALMPKSTSLNTGS